MALCSLRARFCNDGAMRTLLRRLPFAVVATALVVACGGSAADPGVTTDGGTDASSADSTSPTGEASAPTDAACADCFASVVSWGADGGNARFVDRSTLQICRAYRRDRSSGGADAGVGCVTELAACNAAPIAIGDVERALANPDVTAALSGSVPLYGSDPRPVDGAVFAITVNGKQLLIGDDCGAAGTGCVAVPAGVGALVTLLKALDAQEIAKPACAAFR